MTVLQRARIPALDQRCRQYIRYDSRTPGFRHQLHHSIFCTAVGALLHRAGRNARQCKAMQGSAKRRQRQSRTTIGYPIAMTVDNTCRDEQPGQPGACAPDDAPLTRPMVHTSGDRRTLEFTPGMIQSEMQLSAPDRLVLHYARAMMCFTLFKPQPRHILMVGLGGGSLVKFCHRYLPASRITVLELRADVIALRQQFMIPADDARLQVIHADAANYLQHIPASVDVLLVDGFDEAGLPPDLCSARFYADCKRALRDDGVLVVNMFSYDTRYDAMMHRLSLTFNDRLCWFHGIAGNNRIIFAINDRNHGHNRHHCHGATTRAQRMQKLAALWQRLRLPLINRMLARFVVYLISRRGPRPD